MKKPKLSDKEYFAKYGTLNRGGFGLLPVDLLRKHLSKSLDTNEMNYGYDGGLSLSKVAKDVFSLKKDNSKISKEREALEGKGSEGISKDILNLYFNQPVENKETTKLKISNYKPTNAKNKDATYFTYKDHNKLVADHDLERKLFYDDQGANWNNGLYTLGLGEDKGGKYVSAYDIWDLHPLGKNKNNPANWLENIGLSKDQSQGLGKPVEFYDRRYYEQYSPAMDYPRFVEPRHAGNFIPNENKLPDFKTNLYANGGELNNNKMKTSKKYPAKNKYGHKLTVGADGEALLDKNGNPTYYPQPGTATLTSSPIDAALLGATSVGPTALRWIGSNLAGNAMADFSSSIPEGAATAMGSINSPISEDAKRIGGFNDLKTAKKSLKEGKLGNAALNLFTGIGGIYDSEKFTPNWKYDDYIDKPLEWLNRGVDAVEVGKAFKELDSPTKKSNGGNLYFLGGRTIGGANGATAGDVAGMAGIAGMTAGLMPQNSVGGAAVKGAASGAQMGMALGPWGALAGAAIGGGISALGQNKANKEAEEQQSIDDIKYRNKTLGINTMANGGMLTEFNNGGTHEQSPIQGIPQGIAPNGEVNKVEQGETKWQDYIFSDRLKLDPNSIMDYNLPKKYLGKSFADVSKGLNKITKERPNDPISKSTADGYMKSLMGANDEVKAYKEAREQFARGGRILMAAGVSPNMVSQYAKGGNLFDGGGRPWWDYPGKAVDRLGQAFEENAPNWMQEGISTLGEGFNYVNTLGNTLGNDGYLTTGIAPIPGRGFKGGYRNFSQNLNRNMPAQTFSHAPNAVGSRPMQVGSTFTNPPVGTAATSAGGKSVIESRVLDQLANAPGSIGKQFPQGATVIPKYKGTGTITPSITERVNPNVSVKWGSKTGTSQVTPPLTPSAPQPVGGLPPRSVGYLDEITNDVAGNINMNTKIPWNGIKRGADVAAVAGLIGYGISQLPDGTFVDKQGNPVSQEQIQTIQQGSTGELPYIRTQAKSDGRSYNPYTEPYGLDKTIELQANLKRLHNELGNINPTAKVDTKASINNNGRGSSSSTASNTPSNTPIDKAQTVVPQFMEKLMYRTGNNSYVDNPAFADWNGSNTGLMFDNKGLNIPKTGKQELELGKIEQRQKDVVAGATKEQEAIDGDRIDAKALRYAPIAFNALAATGLFGKAPKPKEFSPTLMQAPGKLKAQQFDTEQMRRGVDQSFQTGINSLSGMTGGSGAAMRSGLMGLGAGYSNALGQAYLGAQERNMQNQQGVDQFNLQNQQSVAGANTQLMNQAGMYNTQAGNQNQLQRYEDRLSYMGKAAEGLGDIGYEQRNREILPRIFGYGDLAEYMNQVNAYGGRLRRNGGKLKK